MHLKFSAVNVADPTRNALSEQVSVQHSFVQITERLFKMAVNIHFVNFSLQIIFSGHK